MPGQVTVEIVVDCSGVFRGRAATVAHRTFSLAFTMERAKSGPNVAVPPTRKGAGPLRSYPFALTCWSSDL